jgi:hypothetical protein
MVSVTIERETLVFSTCRYLGTYLGGYTPVMLCYGCAKTWAVHVYYCTKGLPSFRYHMHTYVSSIATR